MPEAPAIKTNVRKSSGRFFKYGVWWSPFTDESKMQLDCIRHGGQWTKQNGEIAGNGLYYHFRRFQEIIWPDKLWQKGPFKNYWAEKILECWIEAQYLGLMGCAAAGKSDALGSTVLTDWYAFPDCTTVLVSSTDLKSLERRIWGMIKGYHRIAKGARDFIPGHLIEGKQMIIQDPKSEFAEGRDFKNGICAVPSYKGSQFVGLASWSGIHNKRVRVVADEANLMTRSYLDGASNLSKCQDFKLAALGNPNETTNAHGIICEPSAELGGWEGGIDQSPGTKVWKTRYPNGLCLQLPGDDSPNFKAGPDEEVPFPFLMTRQQMEDDAKIWGIDDWHFQMMNNAKMPRGQGSHRVITRQECERNGAVLEPFWRDSNITKIASLDAAYRGAGGDRCVFTEINFGKEIDSNSELASNSGIISQKSTLPQGRQILSLVDQIVIPIDAGIGADTPESQIVRFVKDQCDRRGILPANFFFDSGMRTSLVQAFSRDWSLDVQSVDCGDAPTEQPVSLEIQIPCRDYFRKLVTELWFSVRLVIISKQFRNLSKDAMWELCAREWKNTPGNKIEVESKVEMKEKTARSPDLADSLAIAVFGARKRGFQIARLQPPKPANRGPDWRDALREKARKLWENGELEYATG